MSRSISEISRDRRIYRGLAADAAASAPLLSLLALHQAPEVRHAVAGNTNAPTDVLVKLAHDVAGNVRAAAVSNPCIPAGVRELAFKDRSVLVQHAALTAAGLSW